MSNICIMCVHIHKYTYVLWYLSISMYVYIYIYTWDYLYGYNTSHCTPQLLSGMQIQTPSSLLNDELLCFTHPTVGISSMSLSQATYLDGLFLQHYFLSFLCYLSNMVGLFMFSFQEFFLQPFTHPNMWVEWD